MFLPKKVPSVRPLEMHSPPSSVCVINLVLSFGRLGWLIATSILSQCRSDEHAWRSLWDRYRTGIISCENHFRRETSTDASYQTSHLMVSSYTSLRLQVTTKGTSSVRYWCTTWNSDGIILAEPVNNLRCSQRKGWKQQYRSCRLFRWLANHVLCLSLSCQLEKCVWMHDQASVLCSRLS